MAGHGVYIGLWTNWSQGQVMGKTLTIPAKDSALLIAFLALFVSWTGSQLWKLICFAIHQILSTPDQRDTQHFQHLILLRSGLGSPSMSWRIFQIFWSWGSNISRGQAARRNLPLVVLALLHMGCVTFAGIFSAKVTSTNSVALASSAYCGQIEYAFLNWLNLSQEEIHRAEPISVAGTYMLEQRRVYTRDCYGSQSIETTVSCNTFVHPLLKSFVTTNKSCPFTSGMCKTESVVVDSGYIDSDAELGVNAPVENRISFRKRMVCAVLDAAKYRSDWVPDVAPPIFPTDPEISSPGISYQYYKFGPRKQLQNQSYTFAISNASSSFERAYSTLVYSTSQAGISGFIPIPELHRYDAETTIWGLHNRALFADRVQDPWFKATVPTTIGVAQLWKADEPVSFIGCTEQYQFCNQPACTEFESIKTFLDPTTIESLNYNLAQMATFNLILQLLTLVQMNTIIFTLQDVVLLARDHLFGAYRLSTSMPTNQWQLEVQNLFNISLATIQYGVVEHVSPSNIPLAINDTLLNRITKETSKESLQLCRNQKVRTAAYYSFSVLGLSFILVGGSALILLSNLIPIVVSWVQKRSESELAKHKRTEWVWDDALFLHKLCLIDNLVWKNDTSIPIPNDPYQKFKAPWLK
ncbi:hypothetical protein GQ44DRAFT_734499 [Phaeosphaeriaceae sp. PMI808]|nr:hypothetical protein GQ44DRAFT_734499 [Phaeosphaeriaceae sp. PMI808]